MDGTFLNDNGNYNRALYQKAKQMMEERDIVFAPVTGKQCERVEELFEEDAKDFWILGDSATRIKHKNQFVYESLIDNNLGLDIIRFLEKITPDQTIIACTKGAAIIKDTVPEKELAIVRGSYAQIQQVADFSGITDDFIKITVHDPQLRCMETATKLTPFQNKAYIVASEAAWIDITNSGVHKGTTVQELQRLLNVSPEETMSFGDGYNDIELMEHAAFSFAVRNAVQEVKDKSNYITRSNDEDAVLKTIIQILSLEKNSKIVR